MFALIRAAIRSVLYVAVFSAVAAALSFERVRTQDETAADLEVLLVRGLYEQAETLSRARVDRLAAVHGGGSLEVAVASDLLLRALSLNGKGGSASTLALAERTLRNKQAHLGASHPDLAPSLLNLGNVLSELADYSRAIPALERAVELRERDAQPDNVNLADALDTLGLALIRAGRYDDALRALERSLRIKESVSDRNRWVARTLEATASALQWKGDYAGARAPLQRALALQQADGIVHPAYVLTMNLLGLQLWFEGNLPEARDASAKAVETAERTLRLDHPTIAWSLRSLAATLVDLGDVTQARSLQERALAIAERSFDAGHHEIAGYFSDLASSNYLLGAYPTARALFERALKISETRLGSQHDRVATFVYNLALVDASLGYYEGARRQLARATAVWESVFGRDHPFVAIALTELAAVLREQGSAREALSLLERALAIRERRLGANHRDVARTLADLAAALAQVGQARRARDVAARAVRIWEGLNAPEAPDLAVVFALYAELQANRGDSAAARQYYERALAIREKVFGASHPTVADTQVGLARTLTDLGDGTSALKTAASAETTGRDHLRLMLRYLPERQSLNYAASRPRGLDLILSLIGSAPEASEIAMDGLVRSRALVLDEMAARRNAGWTLAEETAPLRAELASAQQRLANLVVRGPGQLAPARYKALVEEARRESELAERMLAERSASFRAELNRAQLGLDHVRASLPSESALVSFVRYERTLVAPTASSPPSAPASHYAAFVLTPEGTDPIVVQLGAANVIENEIAGWRREAGAGALRRGSPTAADAAYRTAGERLRKRTWDPVTLYLANATRVFVVPDGALNLVSFSALPIGTSDYLIDRGPPIHYLSAERDLVTQSDHERPGNGLFALGGPAFNDTTLFAAGSKPAGRVGSVSESSKSDIFRGARSACGAFESLRFEDLGGTMDEANEIAGLWKAAIRSGTLPAGDVQLSVAGRASERAFKEQAPGRRVLHLATHGFFLGDACDPATPGRRAVGGLATGRTATAPTISRENPLLLSGLAFAGANHRAKAGPDEDDGILTAEEIAAMNLEGTEWAVLSACDTGLGEVKAGEGVFGLRRAFQIAGVRTVIMSLWSVDDQATRQWMRALYEARLNDRLDTAESVRAASLRVLRDRRARGLSTHPFYWAAFVAAGDWR